MSFKAEIEKTAAEIADHSVKMKVKFGQFDILGNNSALPKLEGAAKTEWQNMVADARAKKNRLSELQELEDLTAVGGSDRNNLPGVPSNDQPVKTIGQAFADQLSNNGASRNVIANSAMKSLFLYSNTNQAQGIGAGDLCNLVLDPFIALYNEPAGCIENQITVRRLSGGSRIQFTQQLPPTVAGAYVNNARGLGETITPGPTTGASRIFVKPESGVSFATRTVDVVKLAHNIVVSDELLQDCPAVADAIDLQLCSMLNRRKRQYMLTGTGVPANTLTPQFLGLLNQPNILTSVYRGAPRGLPTDNLFDAVQRAITDIVLLGGMPDTVVLNPADCEKMKLVKTTAGEYVFPDLCGDAGFCNLTLCCDPDMPVGTGLVGEFRNNVIYYDRQECSIEMGYVNGQFTQNQVTIQAELRGALAVYRPWLIERINNIV